MAVNNLNPNHIHLNYFLLDFLKDFFRNQRLISDLQPEEQNVQFLRSQTYRIYTVVQGLDFYMRMVGKIVEVDILGKKYFYLVISHGQKRLKLLDIILSLLPEN